MTSCDCFCVYAPNTQLCTKSANENFFGPRMGVFATCHREIWPLAAVPVRASALNQETKMPLDAFDGCV